MADRNERDVNRGDDGLQTGGTRGSSQQGGPEESVHRGEDPGKNSAVTVNRGDDDRGSRSSLREDERSPGEPADDGPGDAPRAPLPPGTTRADYVGGQEPHKTDVGDQTPGASGRRNEVV
jgi:hypothetical protein